MNTALLLTAHINTAANMPIVMAVATGGGVDSWVGKAISLLLHIVGTLLIGFAAIKILEKIGIVGAWKAILGGAGIVVAAIVVFNLPTMPDLITNVGGDVNETVNKFDQADRVAPPAGG